MLAIVEGVYFHVREDALNEDRNVVDFKVLRPVGRLAGVTYSRSTEGYEILRPSFRNDRGTEAFQKAVGKQNGESPEEE